MKLFDGQNKTLHSLQSAFILFPRKSELQTIYKWVLANL